jgi:hypothetical protein
MTYEIIRFEDRLIAKFTFVLDNISKKSTIEFWDGPTPLEIISTTYGIILGHKVILDEYKRSDVCIQYTDRPIECRIAYLDGDDLVKSKTLQIELENIAEIKHSNQNVDSLKGDGKSFETQMRQIPEILAKHSSSWYLKLELEENIVVRVLRHGNTPLVGCFGQNTYEVSVTDFIFTLYPEINSFVIPIELVFKNHMKLKKHERLFISELIRVDFHRIPNILYKHVISNGVDVSNVKHQEKHLLSHFTGPTGQPLGFKWVVINNLPVFIHES